MPGIKRSSIVCLLLVAAFCLIMLVSSYPANTDGSSGEQTSQQDVNLELSVDPEQSRAGGLITLFIKYYNIGLPYTTIHIDRPELVEFDPLLAMPCKYHEQPNGCQPITFRALAPGEGSFGASATASCGAINANAGNRVPLQIMAMRSLG
jgi:hypothetical protein